MGISSLMAEWLDRLSQKGYLAGVEDILDLGPQQMNTGENVFRDVARRQPTLADPEGAVDALLQRLAAGRPAADLFYGLFGIRRYHSADNFDPGSELKFDLNDPVESTRTFSCVTNFGTAEHVFNVGTAFANTMNLVSPGGLALFILPTFGDLNHGFYNIHPTLYFDLCDVNAYELLDFIYVDNFAVRNTMRDALPPDQPRPDFDSFPISRQAVAADIEFSRRQHAPSTRLGHMIAFQFAQNVVSQETQRISQGDLSNVKDYCFAAIRKTDKSPSRMSVPVQGIYRGPFSAPRLVVNGYKGTGYNIGEFENKFYAVHQAEGPFDIVRIETGQSRFPVYVGTSLDEVVAVLDQLVLVIKKAAGSPG
jgi:hypothetical protein